MKNTTRKFTVIVKKNLAGRR
jgi:hypothetical protein